MLQNLYKVANCKVAKTVLLVGLFSITASSQMMSAPMAHFWLNGAHRMSVTAGQPTLLELAVMKPAGFEDDMPDDGSGMPGMSHDWLADFVPMHMKYMHLVVVKKDLSEVAHVHPFYDMGTGYFHIPLNLPSHYPDNFATINAIPNAGEYVVFAEAKSKKLGPLTFRTEFTAVNSDGQLPQSWRKPLQLDPLSARGTIVQCLNQSGELVASNCHYEIELKRELVKGCGGNLLRWFMTVSEVDENGKMGPAKNMEPWMMMGGHALLARDSGQMRMNDYYHLHATMPEPDAPRELTFSVFDRGQLTDSTYRMWVQFQSAGKILTVPFTFKYIPEAINGC